MQTFNSEIRNRVAQLFSIRRLEDHARGSAALLDASFWSYLADLQGAIYALDSYFECNWHVERRVLTLLWERIDRDLAVFVADRERTGMLSQIRAYQAVEWSLRRNALPSLLSIPVHYSLKTCDVRLSRRLIEMHAEPKRRGFRLQGWDIYDLASEVLDDLTDLQEDLPTFNGNRLLLGVGLQNGAKTVGECCEFIDAMRLRAVRLLHDLRPHEVEPVYWAFDVIDFLKVAFASRGITETLGQAWSDSTLQQAVARADSPAPLQTVPSRIKRAEKLVGSTFA